MTDTTSPIFPRYSGPMNAGKTARSLLLVLAAFFPATLAGQQNNWQCAPEWTGSLAAADSVLAARYAPILWFAPGERYFPTVPFFSAFDGLDNDDDGLVDFADLSEIAPSWDTLNGWYLDGKDSTGGGFGSSAVFFRVCDLTTHDKNKMLEYLIGDEQRWHRTDESERRFWNSIERFKVIQYFPFYLNDDGLKGHKYDSELIFVFVPADSTAAERFRIVVGGGHTNRVPSNVLVVTGETARLLTGPANGRPNVLVELGDHSSAPDIPPFGEFLAGWDANWNDYDVWGTRDVQSSSGLGALGDYEQWMTYPRGPSMSRRLFPPVPDQKFKRPSDNNDTYALLAIEPFERLFEIVLNRGNDGWPNAEQIAATDAAMEDVVGATARAWGSPDSARSFHSFSGFRGFAADENTAAATEMALWVAAVNRQENHFPWWTDHYEEKPTRIFKRHLFRPVWQIVDLRQFSFASTWHPQGGLLLQVGWEFPVPPIFPFNAIRVPGFLNIQGGVYFGCNSGVSCLRWEQKSFAVSLTHTNHYNRLFTSYLNLHYVPERAGANAIDNSTDLILGGGVSLAPSRFYRVRVGLSTDVSGGARFNSTGLSLQFLLYPFKGTATCFSCY